MSKHCAATSDKKTHCVLAPDHGGPVHQDADDHCWEGCGTELTPPMETIDQPEVESA